MKINEKNEEDNLINFPNSSDSSSGENSFHILTAKNYGIDQLKCILLTLLLISVEGLHLNLFSTMIIPFRNLYSLSDNLEIIISTIMFIGYALGGFISGYLNEYKSRKFALLLGISLIFICNVLIAFTDNIVIFAIARFFIGICIGITVPTMCNVLCEYLPISYRAYMLTFVWSSFCVGQLCPSITMLIIMPNFEVTGIKSTLLILSSLSFITLVIFVIFFKDSPRNFLIKGKVDDAFVILEKWTAREYLPNERNDIRVYLCETSINKNIKSTICDIFNKQYLFTSILLIIIFFNSSIATDGIGLIFSLTLEELQIDDNPGNNHDIIVNQIIVGLICLPANLFGGLLCEVAWIGRKKSMALFFVLSIISMSLAIMFWKYFALFFGIYGSVISISLNIVSCYASEVYPSKIRDISLGFMYFTTRIGACIGQLMYILLNKLGVFIPYYINLSVIFLSVIANVSLPIETYGKELDT